MHLPLPLLFPVLPLPALRHGPRSGPFTPRAEVTNGRAAMLGFAVLLALEAKAGVPFF
jgi:hypothetical protein